MAHYKCTSVILYCTEWNDCVFLFKIIFMKQLGFQVTHYCAYSVLLPRRPGRHCDVVPAVCRKRRPGRAVRSLVLRSAAAEPRARGILDSESVGRIDSCSKCGSCPRMHCSTGKPAARPFRPPETQNARRRDTKKLSACGSSGYGMKAGAN